MDNEASAVPPGAGGAVASIGPGIMDMTNPGMGLGGFLFPLPLSISGIGRGHLVRAALENICFAIKANLLQMEAISGIKAETIYVGGKITGSSCFKQILPAILNRKVHIADVREVSALGAAMLAAAGSGMYSDINEAVSQMTSELKVHEPDPLDAAEYTEHYQKWLNAVEKLNEMKGVLI